MSVEEMLAIFSSDGERNGRVAALPEVRARGLWHGRVNICVTDGRGNVFQKLRSTSPYEWELPQLWDICLVTVNLRYKEDLKAALERAVVENMIPAYPKGYLDQYGDFASITKSDYRVACQLYPTGGYQVRAFNFNYVVCMPELREDLAMRNQHTAKKVRCHSIQDIQEDLNQMSTRRQYATRPPQNHRFYQSVLEAAGSWKISE